MACIESMLIIIGYSALFLFGYIFIAFIVGTIKKNNGIMDIFYGPGIFVVAFIFKQKMRLELINSNKSII